jgi:hypothetical protein
MWVVQKILLPKETEDPSNGKVKVSLNGVPRNLVSLCFEFARVRSKPTKWGPSVNNSPNRATNTRGEGLAFWKISMHCGNISGIANVEADATVSLYYCH